MSRAPSKTRSSGTCFMPSTRAIRRALLAARTQQSLSRKEVAQRSGLTARAVQALETDGSISVHDLRVACEQLAIQMPNHPASALAAVGRLVRDRRELAQLSRKDLASTMGVCDATLKFLETARKIPSWKTLLSLLAVAELGLKWSDFGGFGGPDPELASGDRIEPLPERAVCSPPAPTPAQDARSKPGEQPAGIVRIDLDLHLVVVGPVRLSDVVSQLGQALVRSAGQAPGT